MKHFLTLLLCTCLLCSALGLQVLASGEQTTTEQASETQTEQVTFTETTRPTSATVTFINPSLGYASCTFYMVMPESSNATTFKLYWGDAKGNRLEGFTPFLTGEITKKEVLVGTSEAFSFPEAAQTVLVYTYSEQFGESATPFKALTSADGGSGLLNYTLPTTGKPVTELVIVSDLHVGSGATAEKNLTAMLRDVVKVSPGAAGILVAGDAVESADQAFYQKLKQLHASVAGAPPMYLGAGDRQYLTANYQYQADAYAQNLQMFLQYAGHPYDTKLQTPYYSYKLKNTLIVFIGADAYENGNAVYSKEQLTWLDGVLSNVNKYDPVLLIMHEPLPGTVSGSLTGQGYGNIQNHQELKDVLKQYSNLTIFSGHTQWDLEGMNTMAYVSTNSRIFNTAGVAHLWNDDGGEGYEVAGSQGYYVTVYENAILIRGRDFVTGEWISNALYMYEIQPTPAQEQQTSASTAKPATTTKPREEESTEEEEPGLLEELGTPLCILAGMTVVVFIVVFYKPKEQA